jgi:peptide chain release factor 2
MELAEARRRLGEAKEEVEHLGESLDLDALTDQIAANEDEMAHPNFWDDHVAAQKVIDANNDLKNRRDDYLNLTNLSLI